MTPYFICSLPLTHLHVLFISGRRKKSSNTKRKTKHHRSLLSENPPFESRLCFSRFEMERLSPRFPQTVRLNLQTFKPPNPSNFTPSLLLLRTSVVINSLPNCLSSKKRQVHFKRGNRRAKCLLVFQINADRTRLFIKRLFVVDHKYFGCNLFSFCGDKPKFLIKTSPRFHSC